MRATIIQLGPGSDKAENIVAARAVIEAAIAADKPALISLPEMWSCLGGDRATKLAQAELLPAPGQKLPAGAEPTAYSFLSETARAHAITVHGGSIGERMGDRIYNTTLVFGPDGAEIGRYRKIHLFDVTTPGGEGYRESSLFDAGDEVVACATEHCTLGLAICYDLRFPEIFLALRRAGAEVILLPSAFTAETGRDHWEILVRARAIETQCWMVAAATCGTHQDARGRPRGTYGHSIIVDPWGRIRAELADMPGFATVELDPAVTAKTRAAMPVLDHRRLA